jgi:hypothetical protein
MLQWFHDMITHGHDLQVRFKWNSPNDIGGCLTIPLRYHKSRKTDCSTQQSGTIAASSTPQQATMKDLVREVGIVWWE